ncbi:MAG: winged helix-turn-helix domain-containing protein [Candidatus Bathyarchaeota archaeon]|nr:winged helix-turn-helix domain-containing protein [Candidatus Bathyarchaeum sp.]
MTDIEEDAYSTIFTSLNHLVRRKILKMLAEEPRTFSDMFESLGISSSHFNYHLDNLGDLVNKTEDGKYKLSFLGEAAMAMMSKVEEAPQPQEKKHSSTFLMKNWKYFSLIMIIGIAFLATANLMQFSTLAKISEDNQDILASNELLWNRYASTMISSDDSPRISKMEAIQIGLKGDWNEESLEGMIVDAKIVIFRFETKLVQTSIAEEPVEKLMPVAVIYEITEKVTNYAPYTNNHGTYHYIWEITVRPIQDYLDKDFTNAPSAIYHVDAYDARTYLSLYELLYMDSNN